MKLSLDLQQRKIPEDLASLLSQHVEKIIQTMNVELTDELGQKCLDILNKEADNEATYWAVVAMMATTIIIQFSEKLGGEEMGDLIFQAFLQFLRKVKIEEGVVN